MYGITVKLFLMLVYSFQIHIFNNFEPISIFFTDFKIHYCSKVTYNSILRNFFFLP